ncbi:MAG: pyruvate ferredoxin oxidoreductase, partial [Candidatus Pacebacteria bacterium]|nr:pyruvate ferredoxin oxidoreductase [Candidatus Paceibacterota bacterium]
MINKTYKKLALTGGAAAAEALRQIEPEVMPIYPITPQTPIIETYAKFQADGMVDTEIIKVESEHSAMSAAVGASVAGARTVTATSSQGLALMNEVLYIASGLRLPILMVVSARALSAPINIHGDHLDVMGARDAGWLQLFSENAQEVYDKTIIGMKLAEKVNLPIMVIMDGFNTSHSVENLETLETEVVKKFVGEREAINPLLDTSNPVSYGPVALQNSYFEFRIDQEKATLDAKEEYEKIAKDYEKISGRHYALFEEYRTEDAEKILVLTGSAAGTAKVVVDHLCDKGEKVGILKINLFRPFPHEEIAAVLKNAQEIIVMDRAQSIGTKPPFYTEI